MAVGKPVFITTAALAAATVVLVWTLPPMARVLPPSARLSAVAPIAGAYHIHTQRSDGSGTIDEVAAAAARAGLRFVVITDHGDATRILPPAYHSGVLCIDAVEISTTGGHYIALGLQPTPYPLGGEPRDVVADVARLGGFGIVAHPYSAKPALRWTNWDLPFNGIEWINADSERRDRTAWQLSAALVHYGFRPYESLASVFARPVESLTRWDWLTEAQSVVGLAGADAHARIGWNGTDPIKGRTIARLPSYEASFRAFAIHVTPARPLSGDAAADSQAVLGAIEAGHLYTSIEALAHPAVFAFTARSGSHRADEGDDLLPEGPVEIHARLNDPSATLVLFRDGVAIAHSKGGDMTFRAPPSPAVYRAEGRLQGERGDHLVPWIVSNPIYVLAAARRAPASVPRLPIAASEPLATAGLPGWHIEQSPDSHATIGVAPAPVGDLAFRFDFTLAGGDRSSQYAAAVGDAGPDFPLFSRLGFQAQADRPLRMSVQLRDSSGRRWQRSVYVDATGQSIVVPFTDLRPADDAFAPSPDLGRVRSVLFVIDLTNARPGDSGMIRVSDVRLER